MIIVSYVNTMSPPEIDAWAKLDGSMSSSTATSHESAYRRHYDQHRVEDDESDSMPELPGSLRRSQTQRVSSQTSLSYHEGRPGYDHTVRLERSQSYRSDAYGQGENWDKPLTNLSAHADIWLS